MSTVALTDRGSGEGHTALDTPITIKDAAAALRAGTITSVELTHIHLDKIEALNPTLGSFITTMPEIALAEAAETDALLAKGVDLGPLQGIPMAAKDIIATKTAPTTANSVVLDPKWGEGYDAAVVEKLRVAGAVFVGSHDGTVFALDQETGCVRWTYHASAEVRTGIAISPWTAGDAQARPALYFGDLLGNVYGVEAFTGRELWRMRADTHPNATITGSPSLHDGRLYVPVSSLEVTPALDPKFECCKFRGSVVAYDAASGEKLWQTYTIETPAAVTGKNRSGTDMYGPSGAPIWNSPAIDAKRGQLYVGTGENYSSPATLTSDAIFAIDLKSGKVKWSYQATPNDAWNTSCDSPTPDNCPKEDGPDFDFGAATMLASLSDGRDLVLGGQKSGMVTALDPANGKLVWNAKVGRGGIQGGIHFGMAAEGDILYVPISDGEDGRTYPEKRQPGLYALDLKTGQYAWKSPAVDVCKGRKFCEPGISAAITAVPGLVLAGGMDGMLRVHDGATGKVLWENDTTAEVTATSGARAHGGSIGGAAGPVVSNGRLFVNSGYGIYGHMPGNVLLVFGPGDK